MAKAGITPVRYLSAREVGDMFGVSYPTIRRMIVSKHINAVRIHPGKQYKIPASEVLRYADAHNIPLVESHRKLLEDINLQSGGLEVNSETSNVEVTA